MYDLVKYLQAKLDSINEGRYHVANERNINADFKNNEVVISAMSATINDNQATDIPYEISIYTTEIDQVMSDFTVLAKTCSAISYQEVHEGESVVITPYFNTPTVLEKDIDALHYAKIVVFASVNEITGINNVKTLKINNVVLKTLNASFNYVVEQNAQRVSGEKMIKSKVLSSTNGLTFTCLNKNSPFLNTAFEIATGQLDGDTSFSVEITMENNLTATLTMYITQYSLANERAKLPSVQISMSIYNPLGDSN